MVEIYYGTGIKSGPYFDGTVVLFRGFLEAGLCVPLSHLVVSFLNYAYGAPQQFTAPSFVPLVVFYCTHSHKELNNGELDVGYFLHYIRLGRSSRNNNLPKSPTKKNKKAKGKTDKGKEKIDEFVDKDK